MQLYRNGKCVYKALSLHYQTTSLSAHYSENLEIQPQKAHIWNKIMLQVYSIINLCMLTVIAFSDSDSGSVAVCRQRRGEALVLKVGAVLSYFGIVVRTYDEYAAHSKPKKEYCINK